MDDIRVTSLSPYAPDPQHRNPESGKRRQPPHVKGAPPEEDEIVLSHAESVSVNEEIVDSYSPTPRSEP